MSPLPRGDDGAPMPDVADLVRRLRPRDEPERYGPLAPVTPFPGITLFPQPWIEPEPEGWQANGYVQRAVVTVAPQGWSASAVERAFLDHPAWAPAVDHAAVRRSCRSMGLWVPPEDGHYAVDGTPAPQDPTEHHWAEVLRRLSGPPR